MKSFAIICIAVLVAGCGGIDLSTPDETRLTGDYHYLWNYDAIPPQLNIGRKTSDSGYTILIQDVAAYGWTNDFIIAKCQPAASSNATSYAILKVNTSNSTERIFQNLSQDSFDRKRKELSVPSDLIFARDYEQKR